MDWNSSCKIVLQIGAMSAACAVASAADTTDELAACAAIDATSERVSCYEALGGRVLAERATGPTTTPPENDTAASHSPASNTAVSELPADLGGVKYAEQADGKDEPDRGVITRCEQGQDKRWIFYFEGGQVWKQNDDRRRFFEDCNFAAAVSRDVFGYRMTIEGHDGKIRVTRKR